MKAHSYDPKEEFSEGCAELLILIDEIRVHLGHLREEKRWETEGFSSEREFLQNAFRPPLGISHEALMMLFDAESSAFFHGIALNEPVTLLPWPDPVEVARKNVS